MKYYINDPVSEINEMYDEVSYDEFIDEFYYLSEEQSAFIGLIDNKNYDFRFSYREYDVYLFEKKDYNGNILFQSDLSYNKCIEYIKKLFESGILSLT